MSRIIFFLSAGILAISIVFLGGVYTGAKETPPYGFIKAIRDDMGDVFAESTNLAGIRPTHWTNERRYNGNGVTVNRTQEGNDELVLLQGFFDNGLEIRLIARGGTVIRRWPISPRELTAGVTHLRNPPATDWGFGHHGVVALQDGSVVFNLDHVGLVKLDRCGDLVWLVDAPTHHSVEVNDDGSFWVSAARKHYNFDRLSTRLFRPPFAEDILLKVGPDGSIIEEVSLLDAFIESDEFGLLTLTGGETPGTLTASRPDLRRELFHLNDVEELPAGMADDFPLFEAGDLLVSLRNRNLILVLDAGSKRIKWWAIGNWVRQHDPDWVEGGVIRVFDNNRDGTDAGKILGSSKIVEINPATRVTRTIYGANDAEFFHSTRRGKHQNLSHGRVLVTETEAGRVFEIDKDGNVTWEYVNKYDQEYSALITEARAYPANYFTTADWSCAS